MDFSYLHVFLTSVFWQKQLDRSIRRQSLKDSKTLLHSLLVSRPNSFSNQHTCSVNIACNGPFFLSPQWPCLNGISQVTVITVSQAQWQLLQPMINRQSVSWTCSQLLCFLQWNWHENLMLGEVMGTMRVTHVLVTIIAAPMTKPDKKLGQFFYKIGTSVNQKVLHVYSIF